MTQHRPARARLRLDDQQQIATLRTALRDWREYRSTTYTRHVADELLQRLERAEARYQQSSRERGAGDAAAVLAGLIVGAVLTLAAWKAVELTSDALRGWCA